MANSLGTNPIYLDTTGATSAITSRLLIKAIVWAGTGSAGDTLAIHDASGGNVVFTAKAPSASYTVDAHFAGEGVWVQGLYLTTLGSGVVMVYV